MTLQLNVVLLGVMVSIIFYEITHISPGGIIVPGLLVLYIHQPERIIYTIVVAILSFLLVKLISKYVIVFGKRRFVLFIIASVLINFILSLIIGFASIHMVRFSLIGYTIAGLIANDLAKQGIKKTIPSLVIVLCIIELIVLITSEVGF